MDDDTAPSYSVLPLPSSKLGENLVALMVRFGFLFCMDDFSFCGE